MTENESPHSNIAMDEQVDALEINTYAEVIVQTESLVEVYVNTDASPVGHSMTFTPEAARELAMRLIEGAMLAERNGA